jgi:hypothetical protein
MPFGAGVNPMRSISKASTDALLALVCVSSVLGCSAASSDGRTVEAGPLLCIFAGDQNSSSSLATVTCEVTVGDTEVSSEGIDVSVTNILQIKVLPDLCPEFSRSDVSADPAQFTQQIQDGLSHQYQVAGSGWTISNVTCKVGDYAAPNP